MMWIFITWVASYYFAMFSFLDCCDVQFWVTGLKDIMSILVTSGIVIYTQFGIYNRYDCYIHSGTVGLQLPEMPKAKGDLEWRLVRSSLSVCHGGWDCDSASLGAGLACWRYREAVKVFLQRDDGDSNLRQWYNFPTRWKASGSADSQADGIDLPLIRGEDTGKQGNCGGRCDS
jgi:hypothetical protein